MVLYLPVNIKMLSCNDLFFDGSFIQGNKNAEQGSKERKEGKDLCGALP